METELYHRLSKVFALSDVNIKDDLAVSDSINEMISSFTADVEASSFRIINVETSSIPTLRGFKSETFIGYLLLSVHLSYKK